MLAVVIGLTRHTLSDGRTDPQTLTSLLGRLQSMSRTYELLSAEQWTEVCVRELIAHEIAIFGTHRICADGDVIRLSPEVALPLSMVLHELATNAAKYGALSNEAGHVDIHWEASNSQFKLTWSEIDGPKVKPGEQSGFGLTLLKGQIEHQLGGTAELAFRPDGFRAQLAVPL
jgi:two-component system CheB/CheR fusion protein